MLPLEHKGHHTRSVPVSQSGKPSWQVLIIGASPSPHTLADEALEGIMVSGCPVRCLHAHSLAGAKKILIATPDIALILLDTSFESGLPGLDLIRWIRDTLKNDKIQITLWLDQPDKLTAIDRFEGYDISGILSRPGTSGLMLQALAKNAVRTVKRQSEFMTERQRRRKLEVKLKKKEAQFRDLIGHIGDLVWQTDVQGNYISMSGNTRAITGYTPQEFLGFPYSFSMTDDCLKNTWPDIKKKMAENKSFANVEISRHHKKNQTRYYLTSGTPIFSNSGHPEGYRGVEKDITDLVRSEIEKNQLIAQLRNAQRLEAIGTLAGGIAHDFNNILGGIMGYAQLLQFDVQNNPAALSHAEQIVSGCNRAKNLILQILDFSRQRELSPSAEPTDPVKIVEDTLTLFRASIPSSIRINTDLHRDAGYILADPSQIHQAVMNLCTNARQAIETEMGQISVGVTPVTLTPDNHTRTPALDLDFGKYITISVSDTGKGIEADTLEKIFDPYFTTKSQGTGTGLGLSVVHGIVTRFNGAITIDTFPGKGTVFTLFFPQFTFENANEPKPESPLITGKACVLFIDDEPMLVDIGKMMLEKLGYRVLATQNPLAGLDAVKEDPDKFDIVITDMTMPDMHGSTLAREVKKINPEIPVVLATGFSNIVKTQNATPAGIDAVLPKPITISTLSLTLHQLLEPGS